MEDPLDIAVEQIVELLFPEVLERSLAVDAGRIDQHVKSAEAPYRLPDHAAAVGFASHIARHKADIRAVRLMLQEPDCRLAALCRAPHQADAGAFLQEFPRRFQPDDRSPARNQHGL